MRRARAIGPNRRPLDFPTLDCSKGWGTPFIGQSSGRAQERLDRIRGGAGGRIRGDGAIVMQRLAWIGASILALAGGGSRVGLGPRDRAILHHSDRLQGRCGLRLVLQQRSSSRGGARAISFSSPPISSGPRRRSTCRRPTCRCRRRSIRPTSMPEPARACSAPLSPDISIASIRRTSSPARSTSSIPRRSR